MWFSHRLMFLFNLWTSFQPALKTQIIERNKRKENTWVTSQKDLYLTSWNYIVLISSTIFLRLGTMLLQSLFSLLRWVEMLNNCVSICLIDTKWAVTIWDKVEKINSFNTLLDPSTSPSTFLKILVRTFLIWFLLSKLGIFIIDDYRVEHIHLYQPPYISNFYLANLSDHYLDSWSNLGS